LRAHSTAGEPARRQYGDSFVENEQWFVHLGVESGASNGDTADYDIAVQACQPL